MMSKAFLLDVLFVVVVLFVLLLFPIIKRSASPYDTVFSLNLGLKFKPILRARGVIWLGCYNGCCLVAYKWLSLYDVTQSLFVLGSHIIFFVPNSCGLNFVKLRML